VKRQNHLEVSGTPAAEKDISRNSDQYLADVFGDGEDSDEVSLGVGKEKKKKKSARSEKQHRDSIRDTWNAKAAMCPAGQRILEMQRKETLGKTARADGAQNSHEGSTAGADTVKYKVKVTDLKAYVGNAALKRLDVYTYFLFAKTVCASVQVGLVCVCSGIRSKFLASDFFKSVARIKKGKLRAHSAFGEGPGELER
jgi:hypothetical protein